MPHRTLALLLVLLAPLALASCGSGQGERNRPTVLWTFPGQGDVLDNVVEEVGVLYDDEIRILNPDVVWMVDQRGQVRVSASIDRDNPRLLRIRTNAGNSFLPGRTQIIVGAGLVANSLNQYDIENYSFSFTLGDGPNFYVATRGTNVVAELDQQTFEGVHTTPTPGGRAPVGLAASQVLADIRVWTQLESGGGAGRSLAWFRPGDDAMSEIDLTHAPGGDLESEYDTVALSRGGRYVFAAYRDTALERVRVHIVDVDTATELQSLVLSPPASAATAPVGLNPGPLGTYLFVACTSAAGDTLNRIDIQSWEEDDIGAGEDTDGEALDSGAGALAAWGVLAYIAPRASTTSLSSVATPALGGGTVLESVSEIPGRPTDTLITVDGRWLMQSLAGYAGLDGLVRRNLVSPSNPTVIEVASDTGAANPMATTVTGLTHYRTALRFLALLDSGALATYGWTLQDVEQEDLDPLLDGIQAADISTVAPQPVDASFVSGIYLR